GDEKPQTQWLKDGAPSKPFTINAAVSQSTFELLYAYMGLGFIHILPEGLDHILFVLGLYLLSTRLQPLLVQVTAFTVAHSITLALGLYGIVRISPEIVEPLIAASIAYVAIENMMTSRLHAWRPFIVFGFGLLHGLGFAGVLQEIGLPREEYVAGLVGFNVGVELGQLSVIGLAWLATGLWYRRRPWYRARVVLPASGLIALTGLYWTAERLFFA
ncbi:MAG: HupE/UreJ family protein, partial [Rickettsiales bacterium]